MGKNRAFGGWGTKSSPSTKNKDVLPIVEKYRDELANLFKEGEQIDNEVNKEITGFGADWLSLTGNSAAWFQGVLSEMENGGEIYTKYYKDFLERAENLFKKIEDETGVGVLYGRDDESNHIIRGNDYDGFMTQGKFTEEPKWQTKAKNQYNQTRDAIPHYHDHYTAGFGSNAETVSGANHFPKDEFTQKSYVVVRPTTSNEGNVNGVSLEQLDVWETGIPHTGVYVTSNKKKER